MVRRTRFNLRVVLIIFLHLIIIGCQSQRINIGVENVSTPQQSINSPLASFTPYPNPLLENETTKTTITSTPKPLKTNTPFPSYTPTVYSTPFAYPLEQANQIRAMYFDRNGDLWTGGPGGVIHWDFTNGEYTVYTTRDGLASNNIIAITQTLDGKLWFGSFDSGLSSFDGSTWQTYTREDGLPGNYIINLISTPDGTLWVDAATTLYESDPDWEAHFAHFDGTDWISFPGGGYDQIVAAPDGTFWASSYWFDLFHFDEVSLDIVFPIKYITAINLDQEGGVWVATIENAYRILDGSLLQLNPPHFNEIDANVSGIAVSPDMVAWFSFSFSFIDYIDSCGERDPDHEEFGVYRYDGKSWVHFTEADGLVDNKICSAIISPDGSVWFGSYDKGISHFDGSKWTTYRLPGGNNTK